MPQGPRWVHCPQQAWGSTRWVRNRARPIQGPLRRTASLSHDGRTLSPPYVRKSPRPGGPAPPAQGATRGPFGAARRQGFGPVGALEGATNHVRSRAGGPPRPAPLRGRRTGADARRARFGDPARGPKRPHGGPPGAPLGTAWRAPGARPRPFRGAGGPRTARPTGAGSRRRRGPGEGEATAWGRSRRRFRPAEGESPVRRDGGASQGPRPLGTVTWEFHVGIDPHPRTQYLPGPIVHSTVRERPWLSG